MDLITAAGFRSMLGKQKDTAGNDPMPKWALAALRKLSARTGISTRKLLSAALGLGIYQLREELGTTANLLNSAEAMARLDPNETVDVERPVEQPVQKESDAADANPATVGTDPDATPASLPGDGRDSGVGTSTDDAGERRSEHAEGESHHDFVSAVAGDNGVVA